MMKRAFFVVSLGLSLALPIGAQTLVQTFESGEITTNWNSTWSSPGGSYSDSSTETFLDVGVGGNQVGFGTNSDGQESSRDFSNNTIGLDVAQAYTLSLYINIAEDNWTTNSSGKLYITDGNFGSNFAQVRVEGKAGGTANWFAKDGNNTWVDLGVEFLFDNPYYIEFSINPVSASYSAVVSRVNSAGVVQDTGSASDLAPSPNAINNSEYGKLAFHVEASSGAVSVQADNINISAVPEPSTYGVLAGMFCLGGALIRRRRR